MTGAILLPLLVIVIATVSVYIAWQNLSSKKWGERAVLIACYIIVLAICLRYSNIVKSINSGLKDNLENFEVNMPDPQAIIDEESEKNYKPGEAAKKSVSADNREPEPSGPIKFENTNDINKFGSGNDLPGLAASASDKFEDISQSETSGTSSVFSPQIVFNGVEGMQIVRPTAKGSDYVEGPASSGFGDINPATTRASTINEYLKPSDELFNNTTSGSSSDAFDWMETFLRRNVNVVGNQQTTACNYNKPYASDAGMAKKVDPLTLTDGSYVPGMTYLPPTNWAVPQYDQTSCRYPCVENNLNTRQLPIGIMDHGTPVFALEIGSDGTIAKTEEEVRLTNVGSILPKFIYRQYVECPNDSYMGGPSTAGACAATTTTGPASTTTRGATTTTRGATTTTRGATTTTRGATTTTRGATTTTSGATTTTSGATTTTGGATTTTGGATTTTGGATTTTSGATTTTRGNTTTTKITLGSAALPPIR